jgi:hypothetical protein
LNNNFPEGTPDPGIVVYTYNPSTQEAKTGKS